MSQKLKLPHIQATRSNMNFNLNNLNLTSTDKKENQMIREAVKHGYLNYPTQEFIWEIFKQQSDFTMRFLPKRTKKKSDESAFEVSFDDLKAIVYLNLANQRIVDVGDISFCVNLKILIMSDNHLNNIDALETCINLFRLDLQNNQIINLPDREFWSSMTHLKILLLHGNPLGRLEYLKYLAACPALEVLTMYDTPISLKYNYRHHAVNSILTLKALDDYVVSDEEIIEEAEFNNIFKAKSQAFKIHLTITPGENDSYESELRATLKLIKKINRVISHYSPVHIFQKFIRGFLTRNRFKKLKAQLISNAARLIQRWWRRKRAAHQPAQQIAIELFKQSESSDLALQPGKNTVKSASFSQSFTTIIDENYRSANSEETQSKIEFRRSETDLETFNGSATKNKRNLIIDLNKLNKIQSSLFEISDSKFSGLNTQSNRDFNRKAPANISNNTDKTDESKFISVSRVMSIIRENLESQENNQLLENLTSDPDMKDIIKMHKLRKRLEDEKSFTEFRLPILVPRSYALNVRDNFVIDLVREKHLGANSIKLMENEIHKQLNEQRQEVKQVEKDQFVTNDQRFFQKAFGNMSLGCLRAVDKAYEDRTLIDKRLLIQKKTDKLKEQNKYSHERVEYYKEDKLKETQKTHKQDLQMYDKARIKAEQDYEDLKEKIQEERLKRIEIGKARRRDINMAIEFSKQHLSVSKALQKHEHLTSKETKRSLNTEYVSKLKTSNEKQRELVKKYTSQRNILRLIQSTNDKGLIEKKRKENIETIDYEAKFRVEKLRSQEFRGFGQPSQTSRTTRIENATTIVNLLNSFRPLSTFKESDSETLISSPVLVPENTNLQLN